MNYEYMQHTGLGVIILPSTGSSIRGKDNNNSSSHSRYLSFLSQMRLYRPLIVAGYFATVANAEMTRPWSILKNESSSIQFSDSGSEVVAKFLVSDEQASSDHMQVTFLDFDTCNSTTLDQHFNFSLSPAYEYGDGLSGVDVSLTLNKDSITNSSAWAWQDGKDDTAILTFCTRVDLLADDAFDMTYGGEEGIMSPSYSHSVSYVKVLYNMTIVMSSDFYLVVDVDEEEPDREQQTTKVDYSITACQCDIVTQQCINDPQKRILRQNSLLNICLQADSEDVVINDIIDLSMRQHDLAITFISGNVKNPLTSVVNLGTKMTIISANLLSLFFISPAPLVLEGAAVLRFADTGNARRLTNLRAGKTNDRDMQESVSTEGTFGVTVELQGDDEENEIEVPSAMATSNFYAGSFSLFAVAVGMVGIFS